MHVHPSKSGVTCSRSGLSFESSTNLKISNIEIRSRVLRKQVKCYSRRNEKLKSGTGEGGTDEGGTGEGETGKDRTRLAVGLN